MQHLDRVLLDHDVRVDAVALDDPAPLGVRGAELRHVDDAAVEQRSVIGDADRAAPGALADERADLVSPELVGKDISVGGRVLVDQRDLGAGLRESRSISISEMFSPPLSRSSTTRASLRT